ncbi:hypothetical protein KKG66_05805 [bacterium]|nr:hypothetical protein [bacterium]
MLFLLIILLPVLAWTAPLTPAVSPESPRVLAMGGAFVAVADDPQAGFLNPAGLQSVRAIGYDMSYGTSTHKGDDELILSYVNPATESGTAFATGFWSKGITRAKDNKFYTPFIGTSWMPAGGFQLGLVTRAVFKTPEVDSLSKDWTMVADLTALQRGKNLSFGMALERIVGGAANMVPRRLRLGTAYTADSGNLILAYEWRADQGARKYTFLYESSHLGAEAFFGQNFSLRGGYVWSEFHRYTFGTAIGMRERGWRIEGGWSLPTEKSGETIWTVGMCYRM